jgi:hypothetical protein
MTATPTTITDPADDFSDETTYTWTTWKGTGNAQSFYYWGAIRKGPDRENGALVTKVETHPQHITFYDATGKAVAVFGSATKFWASAAPVAAVGTWIEVTPDAQPMRTIKEIAATAAKPGEVPSASKTAAKTQRVKANSLSKCLCGTCDNVVKGMYAQGHDARHVSQVVKAVLANPDANLADATELDELPTAALKAKAVAAISKKIKVS